MASCLGVFFLLCGISGVFGACPPDWEEEQDRCYMYKVGPNTFDGAEQVCIAALTGAHLVAINNVAEQTFVAAFIKEVAGDASTHTWIGLHDSETDGSFAWTNVGTILVYENFASGQPSGPKGIEDCVYIDGSNDQWYDNDCNVMNPFVCEGPVPEPEPEP
ncbi:snaclec salmorin subunit A-like [Entelurus aequoreus]|uniref:snaclec salmorin subunit A-like n=1 Tax=Entelurus aequoreus TaxID=161455 RepID=UPI002B1E74AC|nr:snaclec salmorin subunit A-like [Entelurus aequoreus]XP_061886158.1 snaclec salmorin subunit A-like [Entelurus aequoreus]XP_061886159.1 snaclec salmorin subunit A-like [Entelurus aequoreus]XP_061886160.1 snaclec salmorin subunit A-like [Entelurus aequoreus]XP_061886161.1 snaclec salmorin subunit A-like [Entelurus aequoreus]XP_061886162.1 snaclec salmorin subunit A-like [Entelurus aequoreus]